MITPILPFPDRERPQARPPAYPLQHALDALFDALRYAVKLSAANHNLRMAIRGAQEDCDHPNASTRQQRVERLRQMRDALRLAWLAADGAIETALAMMEEEGSE